MRQSFVQNMVSLGGVKVISNPNIASIAPEKRKCYFDHEHPPHQPLTAHQKYSQVQVRLGNNQKQLDQSWICYVQ